MNQKEVLASAMNECSLATGHGDTFDDLVREMVWQVKELHQTVYDQRETINKIVGVSRS